ncbi:zinc ribbon domain-containing protein [Spirochaetia bacterium 38H-sp]|uniref:Zinc ribbon domain-containing protein n=1 Tax=Rarispira pelagica TaxID=3141764 RepID=A0ABU9UBH3_9SPIR
MALSKFYCEYCQKEVRPKDRVCPHCGRFFTDVKCPRCEYTGDVKEFVNGCPSCGYLTAGTDDKNTGQRGFSFFKADSPQHSGKKIDLADEKIAYYSRPVFWIIMGFLGIGFFVLLYLYLTL